MLLFTLTDENDYDILTQNGYYIKKIDYTIKEYEDIINEAKKYYYSYRVISNETDMSDRYHSDNTYYYSVNMTNVLVKDKKFYGVILHGLEAIHSYYLIATINDTIIGDSEINGYNSIDRTYKLLPYDIEGEALDFAVKYYVTCHKKTMKVKDGNEELFADSIWDFFPLADDVIVNNGKAIGVKIKDHDFILQDKKSLYYSTFKEEFCGYMYREYADYKLVKFIEKDN